MCFVAPCLFLACFCSKCTPLLLLPLGHFVKSLMAHGINTNPKCIVGYLKSKCLMGYSLYRPMAIYAIFFNFERKKPSCFFHFLISAFYFNLFLFCFYLFLGSYTLHTDPLVRGKSCLSVSVSECPFEDEMTRDISPRIGR